MKIRYLGPSAFELKNDDIKLDVGEIQEVWKIIYTLIYPIMKIIIKIIQISNGIKSIISTHILFSNNV